jgi:hypothetical protein
MYIDFCWCRNFRVVAKTPKSQPLVSNPATIAWQMDQASLETPGNQFSALEIMGEVTVLFEVAREETNSEKMADRVAESMSSLTATVPVASEALFQQRTGLELTVGLRKLPNGAHSGVEETVGLRKLPSCDRSSMNVYFGRDRASLAAC